MAVIIETRELSFRYSEDSPLALEDVTLSIEEGSFTAVLGHNGSGKSTFAKHLNAILLPSGGKVYVGGIDTADESRLFDIRKTAGMVFQNPDNQIVANVVEEDVAFACENMGLPPEEIRRRVDESLAAVGMSGHAKSAPHLLSGGQKQRVAIAGILAMQPRCIVMDEPTAMLDPSGRAEVMAAIQRLNRSMGVTVVLITHHMDEAAAAQRVIVMKQGRVALDGTPRQIFSQVERMRELSLSVPQTVELLYTLDRDGAVLSLEALSVEECADEILKYLEA
ncbi:MAG: energy-coupling factor transporter ATPase [Clostridia bacterium]|nr:energy-coupling factor transporter ATPase [Clostridia bacterium]